MQKNLKLKLEHLSRDQLLELLKELSNVPDVQKMIKAMVAPIGTLHGFSWLCVGSHSALTALCSSDWEKV